MLTALREQLPNRELFEEFCREFAQEMNRLQSTERARQSAVRQELETVTREIGKLIDAIKNDVPKNELIKLEHRKAELERSVEANPELRPLLHPGMADVYRRKVADLCLALEREEVRHQASEAIRGLLDEIVLEPESGTLRILVKGNLASMLRFTQNAKRSKIARNGRLGAYGIVGCGGGIPTGLAGVPGRLVLV